MVYLATDHAGFELKEKVKEFLKKEGYEVEDFGAHEFNKDDDYPDFISKAAEAVSKDPNSKAIIFGHSGQGEAMVANKFPNIRAAVFYGNAEMIPLTREHNDANILSLGARFLTEDEAFEAVKLWLETPFTEEERHVRRIEKISKLDTGVLKKIEKNI
ncbi:RpiB/LacA/LacB family sugar-phosphate isomerase [Candidatus Daviesbacteria bacterium]|nr:RpiB/LacA/LacB family sugar-phosphate isomerase [Candidatus Daviesbacteria bacterium]